MLASQNSFFCRSIETKYCLPNSRSISGRKRLAAMPVVLHVIALDVAQMTFVWSGFLRTGRSLRQTYLF